MATRLKITLLSLLLLLAAGIGYGRIRMDKKTHCFLHLKETNIGFYKGVSYLDVAKSGHCKHQVSTGGIIVNMPIVHHFKAEVGLDYAHFLSFPKQDKRALPDGNNNISMPLSIQYYFLPQKCRVQSYLGAGTILYADVKNAPSLMDNGELKPTIPGTKYISLLFTQGIIFEINPKIQISESIHFIKEGANTSIGLNFGIGFRLP